MSTILVKVDLTSGGCNEFGDFANTFDVVAGTYNLFGHYFQTAFSIVTSLEDTFFGESASIDSIDVIGGLYFSGPPTNCFGIVTALGGIHVDFPNSAT